MYGAATTPIDRCGVKGTLTGAAGVCGTTTEGTCERQRAKNGTNDNHPTKTCAWMTPGRLRSAPRSVQCCGAELEHRCTCLFFVPSETIDNYSRLFGTSDKWSGTVHYHPLVRLLLMSAGLCTEGGGLGWWADQEFRTHLPGGAPPPPLERHRGTRRSRLGLFHTCPPVQPPRRCLPSRAGGALGAPASPPKGEGRASSMATRVARLPALKSTRWLDHGGDDYNRS